MKKTGWRFPEGNPCLDFVRGNWKAVVLSLSTAWEPDSVWAITVWFGLRVRHHLGQCPDCREVYYFRKRKRIGGNLQIKLKHFMHLGHHFVSLQNIKTETFFRVISALGNSSTESRVHLQTLRLLTAADIPLLRGADVAFPSVLFQ